MNQLSEMRIATENDHPILPNVHIDPFFTSNKCEFDIIFDVKKYAKLLNKSGIPNTKIKDMNIYFADKKGLLSSKLVTGSYHKGTGDIRIYPQLVWDEYKKFQNLANKRIEGGYLGSDLKSFMDNVGIVNPERIWSYLSNPSIDSNRKLKYLEYIYGRGKLPSGKVNSIVLHETKHKIDHTNNPYAVTLSRFALGVGGFVGSQIFSVAIEKGIDLLTNYHNSLGLFRPLIALYIQLATMHFAYEIDPIEVSARKFEKLNNRSTDWDVLNLKPKDPSNPILQ